jgi:uncharacterized protein (TIGR03086 family)
MLNLDRATATLTGLVVAVRDDQLTAPTPCPGTTLGAMLDHVNGLSLAFTAAATKETLPGGSQPPSADASRLGSDWRTRIPQRLAALASAWHAEAAWSGMTWAGGLEMPGEVAGLVALDEIVVHGWDIAVASGQVFTCDPRLLQATLEFVKSMVAQNPNGSPGLFGPPVPVPDSAPLLEQLIGLTGRDPGWRAPTASA